ncbi:MATE family efflux transporter [Colwelliaceae bacterium 6471]
MSQNSQSGNSPEQKNSLLTQPINKLFMQMAMPMVIGMIINGLYNLVDAFFVSRFIGSSAMAAVSIVFPLQMIIIALATTISNGASILVSQYLGANRLVKVSCVIVAAFRLIAVFSVFIAIMPIVFNQHLLRILNVPSALQTTVNDYFMPLALGSILIFILSLLTDLLRAQGRMNALFVGVLVSAIANVILDWLFIVVFNWGVSGAAVATLSGQFIGCIIGVFYFTQQMSLRKILTQSGLFDMEIVRKIITLGIPVLLQYVGAALIIGLVNGLIAASIDDSSAQWLSAYGLIGRFNIFIILPLIAMTNASQTIISFNYGGGNNERVKQALIHGIKANIKYLSIMASMLLIIPELLLSGFTTDALVIETGAKIARMMFILLPLAGISSITIAYFQGVGRAKQAMMLTMAKVYILIVPLLLTINYTLGYTKLWYAFPVADIATVALASYLFWQLRKNEVKLTVQGEC